MIVVEREGMLLVGDAFSATIDAHDPAAHPAAMPSAHFGKPPPPHSHGPSEDPGHDHASAPRGRN
jgi:hypothetical protein